MLKKKRTVIIAVILIIFVALSFRIFAIYKNQTKLPQKTQEISENENTLGIASGEEVSAQNSNQSFQSSSAPTSSASPIPNTPKSTESSVLGESKVIEKEIIKEVVTGNVVSGINLSFSDGLESDGATVKNTDKGSSQNFFKTINVFGSDSLSARVNSDALNIKAGTGISLTSDSSSKTLTISNSLPSSTNAATLNNFTWASPDAIGTGISNKGTFSELTSKGKLQLPSLTPGIMRVDNAGLVSAGPVNLRNDVTNTLPVANGGTGLSTFAAGDLTYFSTGSSFTRLSIGAKNSVLTSSGAAPVWSTSLALPGTLSVTGETRLTGRVGINTAPVSGFHAKMDGDRAIFQMFSAGALSPLNLWNSSTSASAGSGMLFGAGTDPQGGFIGGMLSQRIDAASNSRTALRVLSNGTLTNGESGAVFYLEGTAQGPKLIVTTKIGMGTTAPVEKLHINTGNIRVDKGALCVSSGTTGCQNLAPGRIYASNTTIQAADVAENYISSQSLEPGDVVMPEGQGNLHAVIKTTKSNEQAVLGVISTKPGVTLGSEVSSDDKHPNVVPIALSGRVPVKVSSENGQINVGDSLTTSSIPGVAMKAGNGEVVIGKSLESYSSDDPNKVTQIMVYVNLSWRVAESIPESETSNQWSLETILKKAEELGRIVFGDLELKIESDVINEFAVSLNTLKNPLYIQPLSKNAVDFFKGLIVLTPDGNIKAAGSITSKKILIQESENGAIGTAQMPKGTEEFEVKTTLVTEKSKIILTPNIPITFAVSEKKPGESFVIKLSNAAPKDLKLDWWIIN